MDDANDPTEKTLLLSHVLHEFIDHCNKLQNEDDPSGDGFTREFRSLRELGMRMREDDTHPANEGKKTYNIKKNRYKDILPFDATRVELDPAPSQEGSDYINANFIKDPSGSPAYIASQGPLQSTVNDFWRMLWQYKVKVITMACKLVEVGKKKCEQYWPAECGRTTAFGDINVTMIKEQHLEDNCTVRHLVMEQGGQSIELKQYHYTGWPDHDIPDDIDVILIMIAEMRVLREKDPDKAPVAIHCSAGCGRTGTICAIDFAWDLLKSGNLQTDFDLYAIIKEMREQRQSMIQTPEQYKMAHLAVKSLFEEHLRLIEEHEYANFEFLGQDAGSDSGNRETDDKNPARRPSNYQLQVAQTIENYVNLNVNDQLKMDIDPSVESALPTPLSPSPVVTQGSAHQQRPPTPTKPLRQSLIKSDISKERDGSVQEKKELTEKGRVQDSLSRFEAPLSTKSVAAPPSPVARQPGVQDSAKGSSENHFKGSVTSVSDQGKHKTVISISGSNPLPKPESRGASVLKANSLPAHNNNNTGAGMFPDRKSPGFTRKSHPGSALNSEVGSSQLHNNSAKQMENTTHSQAGPGGDIYAAVNKGSHQMSPPEKAYNPYDDVNVTNGSLVRETPPIPNRGYMEPEPNTAETDKDTQEASKSPFVKLIKNLIPKTGGKSSASSADHSTEVPGFNTRLGKKPSGPRDPPWSKKK